MVPMYIHHTIYTQMLYNITMTISYKFQGEKEKWMSSEGRIKEIRSYMSMDACHDDVVLLCVAYSIIVYARAGFIPKEKKKR